MNNKPVVIVGADGLALRMKAYEIAGYRKTVATSYAVLVSESLALTDLISREPQVAIIEDVPNAQYAMNFLMTLAVTKMLTPAIVGRRCEPKPVPTFIFCVTTVGGLRATVGADVIQLEN